MTHPRWAFIGLITSLPRRRSPCWPSPGPRCSAPDSTQRIDSVGQLDSGIGLDYRFTGQPSAVYPTGEVTTTRTPAGAIVPDDPLYSRLLDDLEVDLAFRAVRRRSRRPRHHLRRRRRRRDAGRLVDDHPVHRAHRLRRHGHRDSGHRPPAVALQVAAVAELTGVGGDAYTISVSAHPRPGRIHRRGPGAGAGHRADDVRGGGQPHHGQRGRRVESARPLTRTVDERATYCVGPSRWARRRPAGCWAA